MKRGISSPSQGHFGDSTKGVFVRTTSNSWPLWHFPRPDPPSRAILPGPCAVSFLISSSPWGIVQLVNLSRRRVSGSRYQVLRYRVSDTKRKRVWYRVSDTSRRPDYYRVPDTECFINHYTALHYRVSDDGRRPDYYRVPDTECFTNHFWVPDIKHCYP